MTEILQKWLRDRLGLVVNMDPIKFAYFVMDGTVIARLLYVYNIISQDQMISIFPTENRMVAFRNLQHISNWLKAADVHCSNEYLLEISSGKSFSAVKLFYQLYLALHDKDKIDCIVNWRAKQKLFTPGSKFSVTHVSEDIPDPAIQKDNTLSKPLIIHAGEINWNKDRYQNIIEQYEEMRERYAQYIREKFGVKYREKRNEVNTDTEHRSATPSSVHSSITNQTTSEEDSMCESQHFGYEDLVKQEENAKHIPTFLPNPKEAKRIVNTLKQKRRREMNEKELVAHQQKMLLMDMWAKAITEQESTFEEAISSKMLKQSEYEKQMATKMFEVRQQKHDILKNRRFVDEQTLKKREEEFLENVFFREKSLNDQKYNYYFEKDRILELHKRLFSERKRLKAERYYSMCLDAVNDMVDVALRNVEYKQLYSEDVPKRVQQEWKNLFVKQQPIFDLVKDLEDIVDDPSDLPEPLEEIFTLEIERQNHLDQREFENYHNFDYPWLLEDLLLDNYDYKPSLKSIENGMNVLGHDVHRVLLTKYPKPKPPPPPGIPKFSVAACINGNIDSTILPALQQLLKEKQIAIVQLEEAINYCLQCYQDETMIEHIDNTLVEESKAALEEPVAKGKNKKDEEKPIKGAKDKGNPKKKIEEIDSELKIEAGPKFVDQQNQTPIIYPCDEIVLSAAGELGKTAYDLLNIGEQLTDNLVVAMFIQYLKTLRDAKGWVLINYPTTLTQAILLEEALTGKPVPIEEDVKTISDTTSIGDVADLEYRHSQWNHEDVNEVMRNSKILPNPTPPREEPYFDTYLTAFIEVKQSINDDEQDVREENKEDEEPTPLGQFYSDQGCNYAFYFKIMEFAAIKHLAKLIIGEYTIPPKTSLELFGDTVLYMEENIGQSLATPGKETDAQKKGDKKVKPVVKEIAVPSSSMTDNAGKKNKDAKGEKGKKGQIVAEIVAVAREDKETQFPEPELEIEEIFFEPLPDPCAGEPFWQYSSCSIPDYLELALAVFWKNNEIVYVEDFKELFFINRIFMNGFMPYLTQVKKHVDNFIARPDDKQVYLHQFQIMYNSIDADLRDDDELKAEVHCRIAEFREKLWEICDRRMREAEALRQEIIADNWVTTQVRELSNNYICKMQLETDRCCTTMQFLTDYYTGIITKMPSSEPALERISLGKIYYNEKDSKILIPDEVSTSVQVILTVPETDSSHIAFHGMLENCLSTCVSAINKWRATSLGFVSKMDSLFKLPAGKKGKDAGKGGKKDKGAGKMPQIEEPEADVKEEGPRLIEEWECAINGEYLRVILNLNAILQRGFGDINDSLNASKKIFYYLYDAINTRYHKEMQSVDNACEVLAMAVEAESPLQPQLVFDGDQFYITPDILLFPEALPEPEPAVTEPRDILIFKVEQLNTLVDIFLDLAPNTSIIERAFVFMLQDMIVHDAEDGKDPLVPQQWKKLKPNQVSFLSKEMFSDAEYIEWRDFIIYNLCVAFPTEEQLLETRQYFRDNDPDGLETVKDYQFYSVKFWFDEDFNVEDPQQVLRLKLIKQLLFKLYCINSDTINYTALLLFFCKDKNLIKGLSKALTLSLGKYVCWDVEEGAHYVASILSHRQVDDEKKIYRALSRLETELECKSIIDSVINQTVHVCDSVVIEDYKSEEDLMESRLEVQQESSTDVEFLHFAENFPSAESCADKFSNVEIGFEATFCKPKLYFLPFEALLNVLTAALPWQMRAQTMEDNCLKNELQVIYDNLRDPEFNNNVLTHQLLNDRHFIKLMSRFTKFLVIDPPCIVAELIKSNVDV